MGNNQSQKHQTEEVTDAVSFGDNIPLIYTLESVVLPRQHLSITRYHRCHSGVHLQFVTPLLMRLLFTDAYTKDHLQMAWEPEQRSIYGEGRPLKFNTFTITYEKIVPQVFCIGEGTQSKYTALNQVKRGGSLCFYRLELTGTLICVYSGV